MNPLVECPYNIFAPRDPELAALFQQHLGNPRTSFAGALARARAEGGLRPGVGPDSADLLVAVVQGATRGPPVFRQSGGSGAPGGRRASCE